ncbi:MAG: hypothetical protein ABI855_07770, partial [Bacteroidota bacterium]
MNQSESNKINEMGELNRLFHRSEEERKQFSALEELVSELADRHAMLYDLSARIISKKNFGSGKIKKEKKKDLAKTAESVAAGIFAFANLQGNKALKNAINYSYSDFYRPHPKTTIGRCRQVLNAVGKITHPSWVNFPKDHLEKFEKMIADFEKTVAVYKNNRKLHTKYTKEFKKCLAETMNFLSSKMDPFMKMLSLYCPFLSGAYFITRGTKLAGRRKHYKKSTVSKIKIGKTV